MATKDRCLLPKEVKRETLAGGIKNGQYNNLNLNQNLINEVENARTETTNNKTFKIKTDSFDTKVSKSWEKSAKICTTKFKNMDSICDSEKPSDQQDSLNKSTLSLHIEAYENATKSQNIVNKNVDNSNKPKQDFFAFPRQQKEEETMEAEVMAFKVSNKLLNLGNTKYVKQVPTTSILPYMSPEEVVHSSRNVRRRSSTKVLPPKYSISLKRNRFASLPQIELASPPRQLSVPVILPRVEDHNVAQLEENLPETPPPDIPQHELVALPSSFFQTAIHTIRTFDFFNALLRPHEGPNTLFSLIPELIGYGTGTTVIQDLQRQSFWSMCAFIFNVGFLIESATINLSGFVRPVRIAVIAWFGLISIADMIAIGIGSFNAEHISGWIGVGIGLLVTIVSWFTLVAGMGQARSLLAFPRLNPILTGLRIIIFVAFFVYVHLLLQAQLNILYVTYTIYFIAFVVSVFVIICFGVNPSEQS